MKHIGPRWNWILRRAPGAVLAWAIVFSLAAVVTQTAQAQLLTTLYMFNGGTDGYGPVAGLVRDAKGNLYGTTQYGGAACTDTRGCGTVFKLNPAGIVQYNVLHRFAGKRDGVYPLGGLVLSQQGMLYGTTSTYGPNGGGTVFQVDAKGDFATLHGFLGGTLDGYNPRAGLYFTNGFLYGTTFQGGKDNGGTVFKMNPKGALVELYSFTGSSGAGPEAALVPVNGVFYSTTFYGGANNEGTVFAYGNGNASLVYSFNGLNAGSPVPRAGVILGVGVLCGTTSVGGNYNKGMVYEVNRSGQFSPLYSFKGSFNGDGELPYAGLVRDKVGNLYGTTYGGGQYGVGTIFKVDSKGTETVLWNFTGNNDGAYPYATLIIDGQGKLYGTASSGGNLFCGTVGGCGTVFELKP